jgi:hypothetical protein
MTGKEIIYLLFRRAVFVFTPGECAARVAGIAANYRDESASLGILIMTVEGNIVTSGSIYRCFKPDGTLSGFPMSDIFPSCLGT